MNYFLDLFLNMIREQTIQTTITKMNVSSLFIANRCVAPNCIEAHNRAKAPVPKEANIFCVMFHSSRNLKSSFPFECKTYTTIPNTISQNISKLKYIQTSFSNFLVVLFSILQAFQTLIRALKSYAYPSINVLFIG